MATIDEATKTQVVIGAVTAAGPGATDAAIAAVARKIINFLSPGSAIMAEFERVAKRDETTEKVKTFRATVLGVDKMVESERGVVFLKSQPSQYHPDGKEYVHTERVDSLAGLEMAKQAQALIGHQVTISVAVEVFTSTDGVKKSRVVRSIVDRGVDPAYNAVDPAFQIGYGKLDVSKLQTHGAVKKAA